MSSYVELEHCNCILVMLWLLSKYAVILPPVVGSLHVLFVHHPFSLYVSPLMFFCIDMTAIPEAATHAAHASAADPPSTKTILKPN
jgi:hypothetical protein